MVCLIDPTGAVPTRAAVQVCSESIADAVLAVHLPEVSPFLKGGSLTLYIRGAVPMRMSEFTRPTGFVAVHLFCLDIH
jgi:hypothetical protein